MPSRAPVNSGSLALGLTALLAGVGPAALALQPREGRAVAAVFAPWTPEETAVRSVWSAGGVALAAGAWGGVVIAEPAAQSFPERKGGSAAFHAALRRAGALFILDGAGLGVLCRPRSDDRSGAV